MSVKPIKTAVLGVGLGGLTFHIPFVLALPQYYTLHAALERNPTAPGGKLAVRFGAEATNTVKIYTTYQEVLNDPEVELVIVSTPSSTHYELAKQALEAGKHVLVDKPVTATAAEADDLGTLAKSRRLVLYPYQNCRYNADFLTLRKLLDLPASDTRSLGTLVEFESRYDRYRTSVKNSWKDVPAPANGLVYDLGSHLIDQALVLFGRPTKITAFIENVRGIGNPDVDDSFTIVLHYPPRTATGGLHPGFKCILRSHILSVRSPQLRYCVRGLSGTYTKHGIDVQEAQLRAMNSPAEIVQSPAYGQEPAELWGTLENLADGGEIIRTIWPTSEKGDYAALFANLAAVIRTNSEQTVKWEESVEVIELIGLAYRSAREEQTVSVPLRQRG